jgi:hypothetical protein
MNMAKDRPSSFHCHIHHVHSLHEIITKIDAFLENLRDSVNVPSPSTYQTIFGECNRIVSDLTELEVNMRSFYDQTKPIVEHGGLVIGLAHFPYYFSIITYSAGISLFVEYIKVNYDPDTPIIEQKVNSYMHQLLALVGSLEQFREIPFDKNELLKGQYDNSTIH